MNKYEQNVNEELYEVENLEDIEELEDLLNELVEYGYDYDEQRTQELVGTVMQHPCLPVEKKYYVLEEYGNFVSRAMNWSEEMILQQKEEAKKMIRKLCKDPKTDEDRLETIFVWGYGSNPKSEELVELVLNPNSDGILLFYALDERFNELDVVEALIKKGAMVNSSKLLIRIAKKLRKNYSKRELKDKSGRLGKIITYKEDDYSNENLWMKAFCKFLDNL